MSISNPGYRLLDSYARDLPGVELFSITTTGSSVTSFINGEKIESDIRHTDGEFWEIMEFDFVEGGPFTRTDEENGNFVAVINESTREKFGFGDSAVGETIRADAQAFRIVGVVRDFPQTRRMSFAHIWVPMTTRKSTSYKDALLGGCQGIILAKSRADFPAIKSEFARRLTTAQLPDPETYETLESGAYTQYEQLAREFTGHSSDDEEVGGAPVMRLTATLLLAACGFMLLPALNLINLSLSRILERSSEIGVRKAFGASSWTLVGQFLVENVVLTLVGGALGFLLSTPASRRAGPCHAFVPTPGSPALRSGSPAHPRR